MGRATRKKLRGQCLIKFKCMKNVSFSCDCETERSDLKLYHLLFEFASEI